MTADHAILGRETDRRVGRPPRVTRDMIARAAYEVGLSGLTMRAVADRLGVSPTSLYYHVRDRDELTRLAAEYSAAKLVLPVDRGQTWAQWLVEWAEYTRAAFVGQPGLLEQFVNGTLGIERVMPNIDTVIGVMEREGFTPDDAMRAYELVSACAVGSAVGALRRGGPVTTASVVEASSRPHGRYEHLEKVSASRRDELDAFRDQLCTVIVGIAVRRGQDAHEVAGVVSAPRREVRTLEVFHP